MKTIVTIDGPAGAGKSTIARTLAKLLGFRFLDTGAMYRSVTFAADRDKVAAGDAAGVARLLGRLKIDFTPDGRTIVDGVDATAAIREPRITAMVSPFAADPAVRAEMARLQREIGAAGRLVCEGRDMGSNVFPDAAVKFYLDASSTVRAERRRLELLASGTEIPLEELRQDIEARDRADSERTAAPLVRTPDMIYVDTSRLTREEAVATLFATARQILG